MAKRPSYKVYPITFAVEGRGQFPFDMLRYDVCFPATSEDVSMLEKQYVYEDPCASLGTFAALGIDNASGKVRREIERTVHLTRLSANTAGPTVDRWKSFGWTVIDDGLT